MNGEDQVKRLLGAGASFAEVSKRSGVGLLQVQRIAERAGIKDPGDPEDAPVVAPRVVRQAPTVAPPGPSTELLHALSKQLAGLQAVGERRDLPGKAQTKVLVAVRAIHAAVELVKDDAGNAQLRAEIDELKALLKAKQARLRKPAAVAGEDTGPSARDVRAWAATVGIDCPTTGRVPKHVVQAYLHRDEPLVDAEIVDDEVAS